MTTLTRDEIIVCLQKLNVIGITVYQQEGIRQACEIIAMPWQRIETAPKDGTIILLLIKTHYRKWNNTLPLAGKWLGDYFVIFNADEAIQRVEPTHWMPIPKAPT